MPDAYHNVESDSDQPIVASIPGQSYNVEFKRLPQGLSNATQRFIEASNHIISSKLPNLVKYLDDVPLSLPLSFYPRISFIPGKIESRICRDI